VEPVALLGSLALVLATYGVLVEAWRGMVEGWGTSLADRSAARIWVLSSMGKYLPGKVWAVAGMAALGREAGVPPGVATASAIALQLLSIGTGAVIVAATGLAELERIRPGAGVAMIVLVIGAGACFWLIVRPELLNALAARWLGRERVLPGAPPARPLVVGLLANAAAWVAYGVALYWLAHGVFADAELELVTAILAFTASYLAGFLFLLAPGGLGVREGVFVLLTQSSIGPTHALALAAISRIGMTLADVLAAAPFIARRRSSRVHS
jgi:hypothetical protein